MSLKVIKYLMRAIGAKPNGSAETWNIHVDAVKNVSWVASIVAAVLVYLTALAATPFQVRAMKFEVDTMHSEQREEKTRLNQLIKDQSARMDLMEQTIKSTSGSLESIDNKLDILLKQGLENNANRRNR